MNNKKYLKVYEKCLTAQKKMVVALEKSLQAKDAVFRAEQFYRSDKTDKSYSELQKRKRELETAKKDYEKLEKEYLKSCIEMDQATRV